MTFQFTTCVLANPLAAIRVNEMNHNVRMQAVLFGGNFGLPHIREYDCKPLSRSYTPAATRNHTI